MPEMEHPVEDPEVIGEAIGTATDAITGYASRKCRRVHQEDQDAYTVAEELPPRSHCPACRGTGFQHWQLWDRCRHQAPQGPQLVYVPPCPLCDDSGWILAVTEGKLLELCFSKAASVSITEVYPLVYSVHLEGEPEHHQGSTVSAALCMALSVAEG